MSIDYARRNLENKQRELSRSGEKRAQAQKKVAESIKKESDARIALSKARTESSIRSKQRALDSASKKRRNSTEVVLGR